jgi:hypothetical protein
MLIDSYDSGPRMQMFKGTTAKAITPRLPIPAGAQLAGGEATNLTVTVVYPKVVGDASMSHQVQLIARRYAGPRSQ